MQEKNISCCFSGYRPKKFGFDFELDNKGYQEFSERLVSAIYNLYEKGYRIFYNGCAQGFDIAAAEVLLLLKDKCPDIKLYATVPFIEQDKGWAENWKKRYQNVMNNADKIIVINPDYAKWAYIKRNEFMVENSSTIITYFDGESGGTESTLEYAKKKGLSIVNIYSKDPIEPEKSIFKHKVVLEITKENEND